MHQREKRSGGADLISAAALDCYAYSPEQWRLQYGLGLDAQNEVALDAGNRHHARKALAERVAAVVIGVGWLVLVGAVAAGNRNVGSTPTKMKAVFPVAACGCGCRFAEVKAMGGRNAKAEGKSCYVNSHTRAATGETSYCGQENKAFCWC